MKANHNVDIVIADAVWLKQKLSKEQLKANHNPGGDIGKAFDAETKIVKGTIESKFQQGRGSGCVI